MSKKSSKNQKNTKINKKVLLIALASFLIIASVLLFIIFSPSRTYTVAFYKVEDVQRHGITATIKKIAEEKKFAVEFIQYNSDKSLEEQVPIAKKPALVITTSGFAVDEAIDKASFRSAVPADFIQGMTSSMRSAIKQEDGKIQALPFLSSHYEVDIDLAEFRNSNTKQINTWKDVEKFMREQKRKQDAPMVFAGGNPDDFLDFAGAFAESLDGAPSYGDAVQILKNNKKNFNPVRTAIQLCDEPDSPLATTVKQLKSWYKSGFIHPGVFSFQTNDVEAFASSRLSSVLFMSFENHRQVAQKTISRYTSIYFPSENPANTRVFTGKSYFAVPLTSSEKTRILLPELLSTSNQEALSRSTQVAPVLAQSRIPDKQADDARYWIAATTAPLAGLSNEVYLTKQQKIALAAEIASRIKN
ncbi:hypothetical protein [uncultured Treponema sp.]|uniref:hypothetical protein n=1 Tax=uncultured Treponema sp. TaxID=162155 RepID=UPI0025E87D5E|nr:hypothetical protein [uncultured Treponema sp.]